MTRSMFVSIIALAATAGVATAGFVQWNSDVPRPDNRTDSAIDLGNVADGNTNTLYPELVETSTTDSFPSVPFGNGNGVAVLPNAVLTLHADNGSVIATRQQQAGDVTNSTDVVLSQGNVASSLSHHKKTVLAVWQSAVGLETAFSENGGQEWDAAATLRNGSFSGAALPTSCVWKTANGNTRAIMAWVEASNKGEGGPIMVREWRNGSWQTATEFGDFTTGSSPSLACNKQHQGMVARSEDNGSIELWFATRTGVNSWQTAAKILDGADPNLARCQGKWWTAYHRAGAKLASSEDGSSWDVQQLDDTGKFESVSCSAQLVAVTWGDYTSLADATGRDDSKRRLGAAISRDGGDTWKRWEPAGDATGQGTSSINVYKKTAALFWRVDNGLRTASWTAP